MSKYIIRLDDACPTMDLSKWNKIFKILDKYNVKPIIAVIPKNEDESMIVDEYRQNFWDKVKKWESKGYKIGMHGFNHKYISKESGIIPLNKQSEFAGVEINIQRKKIQEAWAIFLKNKLAPKIWIAPSHTFDKNTLQVLKEETDIEMISDSIAYYPYLKNEFFWLPQQLWWYKEKREGIWTICLHPNNMSEQEIEKLDKNISDNLKKFNVNLKTLYKRYSNRKLSIYDTLYCKLFFLRRNLSENKFIYKIYKTFKHD